MSKRSGGVDIETNRTSQRGVYCGAWSAYIPGEEHVYQASVRVTRPSRFFVLDASAFAEFMQKEFPMAVHLLEGHMVGGLRQRQILGPAGETAGPGSALGGPDPSAQQPGRRDGACGGRPARRRGQDAAQARDARRRQVHSGRAEGPGEHPGRGRRAGGQVEVSGAHRAGDLRPRGPDRRLARRARHRQRVGLRADVRRGGTGRRLAGAGGGVDRRRRLLGDAARRDRLAEVHDRHRTVDEPDRRSQQADLGAAGRRQAVLADGPRGISERQCARAAVQHDQDDLRRQGRQGR